MRSQQGKNAEEEVASTYHQNKVKKTNLTKIKFPRLGDASAENVETVTSEDPKEIEDHLTKFYDALFNGRLDKNLKDTGRQFQLDYSDLDEFLGNLNSLSPAAQATLEEALSLEELECILKSSPYESAPGLDGLTFEFHCTAWPIIKNSFHKVLQVQLTRCRLTESGKQGATRLIPKVEGIPEVKDLRPITLLNVDYRIL